MKARRLPKCSLRALACCRQSNFLCLLVVRSGAGFGLMGPLPGAALGAPAPRVAVGAACWATAMPDARTMAAAAAARSDETRDIRMLSSKFVRAGEHGHGSVNLV